MFAPVRTPFNRARERLRIRVCLEMPFQMSLILEATSTWFHRALEWSTVFCVAPLLQSHDVFRSRCWSALCEEGGSYTLQSILKTTGFNLVAGVYRFIACPSATRPRENSHVFVSLGRNNFFGHIVRDISQLKLHLTFRSTCIQGYFCVTNNQTYRRSSYCQTGQNTTMVLHLTFRSTHIQGYFCVTN